MRLLLIEDEENIALALKTGLEHDGFHLDIAIDGATGLWMAMENIYGVILLDLMLPELDGITVCSRLRENNNFTPVLMLTAKGDDTEIVKGLSTGADDYLAKPFSYAVLLARIQSLLRRPRGALSGLAATSVQIGDLELDFIRKIAIVSGVEIDFSKREFKLLQTLSLASGRILSKQFLLDQVWGEDFNGSVNIVEVYIGYLRRKLLPVHCDGFIQTVRGTGYRVRM